jgi:hypothetical protein
MLVLSHRQLLEDAMKFALSFLNKFAEAIVAILGCFDRVTVVPIIPVSD